ncbi:hypothetical protein Plhal304r1_c050g0132621 [Plasmopara halstedii]
MACALIPNLTELNFLQLVVDSLYEGRLSDQQRTKLVEAVKKTFWDMIFSMAIRASTKLSAAGGVGFGAGNPRKDNLWRGRGTNSSAGIQNAGGTSSSASNVWAPRESLVSTSNLFKGLFDKRASVAGNILVGFPLETLVDEKIESFLKFTLGLVMPHDFEPQNLLDVSLKSCSVAGIESDFGIAGVLLNPRKTNLDTFVVQQAAGGRSKFVPKRYTTATPAGSTTLNEADDENNAKADRIFTAENIENDFDFFTAGSMDDD